MIEFFPAQKNIHSGPSSAGDKENRIGVGFIEALNRNMAEKSAKSHVETSAVEEESTLAPRERNLPSYLNDYIDVPGQNKLQTIKNRRKSMKANLSKKVNTINEYLEAGKNRKLIELALTQLNRAWEQLIKNHKEFETLCSDDKELQDADTWLLESQAVVEELVCKTVEYQEAKMASGGSVFSAPIVAEKSKQGDKTDISSVASVGRQSSKKIWHQ